MAKNTGQKLTQFDIAKDKDKFIYFKMSKAEYNSFLRYECIIRRFIEKKRVVPARLFDKFQGLVTPIAIELQIKYDEQYSSIIAQLYKKFVGHKRYEFSYINPNSKQRYYLSDMLDVCLHSALEHHYIENQDRKEFCLKSCYQSIQSYISEFPPKEKKFISHYKRSAISGFVAMLLGHELNKETAKTILEGDLPTSAEVFHAIHNTTKKFNIKKRK